MGNKNSAFYNTPVAGLARNEEILPEWTDKDVEAFIEQDSELGPVLQQSRELGSRSKGAGVVFGLGSAAFVGMANKSVQGALITGLAAGLIGYSAVGVMGRPAKGDEAHAAFLNWWKNNAGAN
eukprot:TRINITY_DN3556_c0_g1_i1.p1 TRINITY_DN3556_c0_g1~~TRINITY_DN3556_c0_g1_i1.p1  ORF type:complete len:138 (-),score=38.87 TRINITY_DN3556_c0_g1_i1:50-418(-)